MSFFQLRSPRVNNVLDQPSYAPSLTTNAATGIGATSATANGSLDSAGGFSVTEQGFVYSTSANPTTSDSKVTVTAPTYGSYSQNITGLTSGVTYHFRAYAINSYGTSYGGDQNFTPTSATATVAPVLMLMGMGA